MDTRFFQQPHILKVPLYPSKYLFRLSVLSKIAQYKEDFFLDWICRHYCVAPNQILLARQGSEALFLFLKALQQSSSQPLQVAVPAFCCKEVLLAIVSAGMRPFFIDITETGGISFQSIDLAYSAGCKVIIIPHFFGERVHNFGSYVKSKGMILINDEAQSFPSAYKPDADISLFSCGGSKTIASVGGGGLCFHNNDLAKELFGKMDKYHFEKSGEVKFEVHSIVKKKLIELYKPLAKLLMLTPHLQSDLKIMLGSWSQALPKIQFVPMSNYQKFMAIHMCQKYRKNYSELCQRSDTLKRLCENKFGGKSISLIREIVCPSIFAIRVPSRYEIARKLALKGIQTTWYYFPLNNIPNFMEYGSENTPITTEISSQILILPFQWKHSSRQFNLLCEAIFKCT